MRVWKWKRGAFLKYSKYEGRGWGALHTFHCIMKRKSVEQQSLLFCIWVHFVSFHVELSLSVVMPFLKSKNDDHTKQYYFICETQDILYILTVFAIFIGISWETIVAFTRSYLTNSCMIKVKLKQKQFLIVHVMHSQFDFTISTEDIQFSQRFSVIILSLTKRFINCYLNHSYALIHAIFASLQKRIVE